MVATILTGNSGARPEDAVAWISELCDDLSIPSLADYGITLSEIADIVAKAADASSMKANPILLTAEELENVLEDAIR